MKRKIWGGVLAALIAGVVVLAWMIGAYFLASVWGMLGLLMLAEKLNQRYGWTTSIKIYVIDKLIAWLKSRDKKDKDLPTFMNDRYTGKDRINK